MSTTFDIKAYYDSNKLSNLYTNAFYNADGTYIAEYSQTIQQYYNHSLKYISCQGPDGVDKLILNAVNDNDDGPAMEHLNILYDRLKKEINIIDNVNKKITNTTTIDTIKTNIGKANGLHTEVAEVNNMHLYVSSGDMFKYGCDVIVAAANNNLGIPVSANNTNQYYLTGQREGGNGRLQQQLNSIKSDMGGSKKHLYPVVSDSFGDKDGKNSNCKFIISVDGPDTREDNYNLLGKREEASIALIKATVSVLELIKLMKEDGYNINSVVFPLLSAAIFGFYVSEGQALITLYAINSWMNENKDVGELHIFIDAFAPGTKYLTNKNTQNTSKYDGEAKGKSNNYYHYLRDAGIILNNDAAAFLSKA